MRIAKLIPTVMGGGKKFSPASVNPYLWFESDYGIYQDAAKTTPATADAQPVGAVVNRGSLALDLLQSTPDNRMTLKTNILNGNPVIRGAATPKGLSTVAFPAPVAQPNTMFYVAKFATDFGLSFDGEAPNRNYLASVAASGWYIYAGSNLYKGTVDTNYHLFTVCYNGVASYLRVDGVQAGTAGNPGTQGIGLFKVSCGALGAGGDFAAAIGVAGISDSNRDLLEGWLISKYGPF